MSDIRSTLILVLLTGFLCAWAYTEITEEHQRQEFQSDVQSFMYKGDRFTRDDAIEMSRKIEEVEAECNRLVVEEQY